MHDQDKKSKRSEDSSDSDPDECNMLEEDEPVSREALRGKGLHGLHGVGTEPIAASPAPLHMPCNMRTHQSFTANVYMLPAPCFFV
jgi:hypothetical protein